jgi:fructosamine-3-kinase
MGNGPELTTDVPRAETIRQIVVAALGEPATKVTLIPEQGNVNIAYDVDTRHGSFIVRVRFDRDELHQFLRERRCAELIRAEHDWTPQVLAIGKYEKHSYSIQEKVQGTVASQYKGDMNMIWEQVGRYAEFFHGIQTSGYIYDAFREGPAASGPWCQWYFDYLGEASNSKLITQGLMTQKEFEAALEALAPLKSLEFSPTLAHGNLSPKNLMIDVNHKAYIIDWGTCQGHMGSELDVSELLAFDTPHEHMQAYLRGHKLPADYVEQNQELLERLQLVRCFTSAHWLCETSSQREKSVLRYVEKVRASLRRLRE